MKKPIVTRDNAEKLAHVYEYLVAHQKDLARMTHEYPVEVTVPGVYRRVWCTANQIDSAIIELGSALADFHHPPQAKNRLYVV